MKKRITLTSNFGNNIFTRNSISEFFKKINFLKDAEIILDFESIKFISRSCADEYLKQKNVSKKKIIEANMSKEVCDMFENVKNQYKTAGVKISFEVCSKQGLVLA